MRRGIVALFLLLFMVSGSGCSILKSLGTGKKDDELERLSAEQLYKKGSTSLKEKHYTKAVEYYEKLQARNPFGEYAQQAQLDLAYAYFKDDQGEAAVAACDRFIKLYPTHPRVDYAYYLKGLSQFNQGKGLTEKYLPIDASQRDQAIMLKSFQDFSELVRRFPQSRYADDATQRMIYLRNLLAQHEVHIANYYMRRAAYVAAANRARYVVENYQGSPIMPEALVIMVKAYRIMELDELANDALRVLEKNYPDYKGLADVKRVVVR